MNILKKILNLMRFWSVSTHKTAAKKRHSLNLKQSPVPSSIKDLEKAGLTIRKINETDSRFEVGKEKLIYAGQLPQHIFPWVIGMTNGLYLIKFPPGIQAQINSGVLNVTGGVARNSSGQIMIHGTGASLLSLSPIILYQVGVIAFGSYHLKKINESLKRLSKKLDEISAFQSDKRTAQINSHFQEFCHISKGILEFNEAGNIEEVLKRIDMLKSIRLMNLTNLLHLEKNLKDKRNRLKGLYKSSFGTEKDTNQLMNFVESYERDIVDYQNSLLLDIVLTKSEVSFSVCKSYKEAESRLSAQKEQLKFFKDHSLSFERLLNRKSRELIDSMWNSEETIKQRRRKVKAFWNSLKEYFTNCTTICKAEIRSIESIIKPQDNIIFLKTGSNLAEKKIQSNKSNCKKTA